MKASPILVLMLPLIFLSNTYAASWAGHVDTNTTSWSIDRDSATVGFNLGSFVEGDISPIVGPGGRILGAYHSYYSDVDVNDVRLSERTAAFEGQYSSEEVMRLRAETLEAVNFTATKPAGSDVWTIAWYETWPVTLLSSKTIDYTGDGINDRDYAGNNLDYAGMSFLYNKEFSKDRKVNLQLDRMNVTVVATNDSIISANLLPTKSIDYEIESHSTGIADLEHKLTGTDRTTVISRGEERYMGVFDISRKIGVHTEYNDNENESDWLSCCFGGYDGIDPADLESWDEFIVFEGNCCF